MLMDPSRGTRALGKHHEGHLGRGALEHPHAQHAAGRLPIADRRAVDLAHHQPGWQGERNLARQALHDLHAHGRQHLTRVFAKPDELDEARPHAQRHLRAAVVDLPLPRKRQCLVRTAKRGPSALGRRLGVLGDKPAIGGELDAASRRPAWPARWARATQEA